MTPGPSLGAYWDISGPTDSWVLTQGIMGVKSLPWSWPEPIKKEVHHGPLSSLRNMTAVSCPVEKTLLQGSLKVTHCQFISNHNPLPFQ